MYLLVKKEEITPGHVKVRDCFGTKNFHLFRC